MHWVYILKCENNHYYVGETTRLYTRFWEHLEGNGGLNTSIYKPTDIVAIYKVSTICKFIDYNYIIINNICNIYFNRGESILKTFNIDTNTEYDNLCAENNVTECMMLNNIDNWQNIRGGKYTRFDVEYTFPDNNHIKHLPLCKCGFPCDIKKHKEYNYLYFRCPKKNMWSDLKIQFNIVDEPCSYYKKYTNDNDYNKFYEEKKKKISDLVNKSYWLKELIGGNYEFCVGGCGKEYDENNSIRYSRRAINLCFDCFIQKNEELKNKYNELSNEYIDVPPKGVCLIKLI
jgi:hypothetical protein